MPATLPSLDHADSNTLENHYCRVASTVGRLSANVVEVQHGYGVALAHYLKHALQLTGILREIDEDAGIGRIYFAS
ncbi:MAG: squalene synthase HpnD [Herminiimonas sp.]|nr:squalene synthase HpnD [Herminiimonas sp.]